MCSERSPNRDINQNSSGARVPAPPLRQASFLIVFVCGFFSMLVDIQSFDVNLFSPGVARHPGILRAHPDGREQVCAHKNLGGVANGQQVIVFLVSS